MNLSVFFSKRWLALCSFFVITGVLHAGTQPKFTIIPITATTIEITTTGLATVQYVVTNQTQITRTLTMVPIQGITQLTSDSGACSNPFTLGYQASCVLTLQLTGSELPSRVTRGPEICKIDDTGANRPDSFLCSQPSFAQSLDITRTDTTGEATISISSGSPLSLQTSGGTGTITVENTSTTEIAADISADFTGTALEGLVSVTGSTCTSVNPGDTCTLTFTPDSTDVAVTDFPIFGSNTTSVTGAISIAPYYAYITNHNSSSVSLCSINTDGSLGSCQSTGTSGSAFSQSYSITLNPDKTYAYITSEAGNVVVFCPINSDKTLGTCVDSGNTGTAFLVPTQLTFNSDGSLAYVGNGNEVLLCPVNSTDGTFGACAATGSGFSGNTGVVLNAAGTLAYVSNYGGGTGFILLCSVDATDGTLSNCINAGVTGLRGPWAMALNPLGTFLYITNQAGTEVTVCAVSATDGALSACTSATTVSTQTNGIALNSANTLAYLSNLTEETASFCPINTDGTFGSCTPTTNSTFDGPTGIALLEN